MKNIIEIAATDSLLKTYFLRLQDRGIPNLDYDVNKLKHLTNFTKSSALNSAALFACCRIIMRWHTFPLSNFIPPVFYYLNEYKVIFDQVNKQPILYTGIKKLDGIPIYEARYGLFPGSGCDIIDLNGTILGSINPNLYDDGDYSIKVLSDNLMLFSTFDNNNGELNDVVYYQNNTLSYVDEISNLEDALKAVRKDGSALQYVSKNLRKDKRFVLEALKQNGSAFQFASNKLKDDLDVVRAAILQDRNAIKFVSEKTKAKKEIAHLLLSFTNINNKHQIEEENSLTEDDIPF